MWPVTLSCSLANATKDAIVVEWNKQCVKGKVDVVVLHASVAKRAFLMPFLEKKMKFFNHGTFSFVAKNAIKHEKCPIFEYRAFFQKSLCCKNPILGIFSLKMGHFFVPRSWQPCCMLSFPCEEKRHPLTWFSQRKGRNFFPPTLQGRWVNLRKKAICENVLLAWVGLNFKSTTRVATKIVGKNLLGYWIFQQFFSLTV